MAQSKNSQHVPLALYKKIIGTVPILTVDVVIVHRGKVLLHKRANEPYKGFWWTPGGRVFLGESPERAAVRKAREEVGLHVKLGGILGTLNAPETRWGIKSQTISIVYEARLITARQETVLDSQSTDVGWFSKIPSHTQKDVRKLLRKAGIR
ncbi:MAG: NUDIX hydrolase [Patescibacteria group bacterium]